MKACTPSYVKLNMAKVLDAALEGEPTVISRKGRLAVVKEFDPQVDLLARSPAIFHRGMELHSSTALRERKRFLAKGRKQYTDKVRRQTLQINEEFPIHEG